MVSTGPSVVCQVMAKGLRRQRPTTVNPRAACFSVRRLVPPMPGRLRSPFLAGPSAYPQVAKLRRGRELPRHGRGKARPADSNRRSTDGQTTRRCDRALRCLRSLDVASYVQNDRYLAPVDGP
jgi:hypothetical protein